MKSGSQADPLSVDARKLSCPLPILMLARALRGLAIGGQVELLATDPATAADLRAFCGATGHNLRSLELQGGVLRALIRKERP